MANVLIVSKKTKLDHYKEGYKENLEQMLRDRNIDYDGLLEEHRTHYDSLLEIRNTLIKYGIKYEVIERQSIESIISGTDIVLVVGGDGTLVTASHYIHDDTLVWGINSDPKRSEGARLPTTADKFEGYLKRFLKGEFNVYKIKRVKTEVFNSGSYAAHAINEVYVGDPIGWGSLKYRISVDGVSEKQLSSPILVCTYDGFGGWLKHIRGCTPFTGEAINKLKYLVQALHPGKVYKASIEQGFAGSIEITSLTYKGAVALDSPKNTLKAKDNEISLRFDNKRVFEFDYGHKIRLTMSDKPIHLVHFEDNL